MARINHEIALDVLREKVRELKEKQQKNVSQKYASYTNEITSLENTIFTLELDQEHITFR